MSDREWTREEINVRPTPRSSWWLMVKLSWDALVGRTPRGPPPPIPAPAPEPASWASHKENTPTLKGVRDEQ
jgi:hypothetical protein